MRTQEISPEEYHLVFENNPNAVFLTLPDGTIEAANLAASAMFGMTESQLCDAGRNGLVDTADPRLLIFIEQRRKLGTAHGELRLKRGKSSCFEAHVTSTILAGGKRSVTTVRMDDLSLVTQSLRETEECLQFAKEATGIGIYELDPASGWIKCDEVVRDLWEVNAEVCYEEFLGKVHSEDKPVIEQAVTRALASKGGRYRCLMRVTGHAGGKEKWVESSGTVISRPGARPRILGTVKDITGLEGTEPGAAYRAVPMTYPEPERVEESHSGGGPAENRPDLGAIHGSTMSTILDTLPVGVFVISANGEISYLNPAGMELWEEKRKVPRGTYADFKLFSYDSNVPLDKERHPLSAVLSGDRTIHGELFGMEKFSGSRTAVRVSAAPFRDQKGEISGAVAVYEDVTEQQELQKKLLHSQKLESIGALAGGVAHDFNNLLTAIGGFAELVYSELTDETLRGTLSHVLHATEKGRDLAQKLLVFSRQQILEKTVIDLSENVENVIQLVSQNLGDKVMVRFRLHESPLLVKANSTQLDQVLINLIINARDAMPEGGNMTIATGMGFADEKTAAALNIQPAANYATISVSDSGIGMSTDFIERIFDPYFTTKSNGGGSGLGLAMVHGIVRQHDGGIKVESREGEGSTFTIYLPLTREVPVSKNIAARRVLPEGGESILVVEDDKMVLHFLTRALTRAGYRVHTAENASDAVETFASNKIDLLLTDVMIPEKNGMELYAEMKCRRPELKVIFASGYTSDIMSSNEIGNQGLRFVQKPFSRQTLLQIIREVLDSA